MSPSPDALALDRQNPWPGLATYDEASQAFFFGRDDETAELLRLVRVAPLTILYSASGLGKSSLLLAGLFPRLRAEHYLPVHLRLDFSETAQSGPLEQALRRLEEEIVSAGAEATARKADEDLWRYLHRGDFELWSADNFPLVPVLVFDQFEELFSRGAAREHVAGVLDALADLVENRTPPELVRDDVAGREALRRFDLRTQRYRVVLSFREEFLPEIVGWKKIPSLLNNALQLLPMSRQKAIAATELAGRDVLAAGVAERIVDLVSRGAGGDAAASGRLADEIEPVLLSLCCTRLNGRRAPGGRIDAALVDSAGQDILESFYREAVEEMPERVRRFIESELIQGDRYRGSYPRDEAIKAGLLTRQELEALTDRFRLLRVDQQADTARIELIHDRMVEVVRASRDERIAHESELLAQRMRERAEEEARRERERRELAENAQARAEFERERASYEKTQAQRQRARADRVSRWLALATASSLVGVLIAVLAALHAVEQRKRAEEARLETLQSRLVGEALAMFGGAHVERPDRVLLQLMAARDLGVDTHAVEGAMLEELVLRPQLLKLIATAETVSGLAFLDDARLLVATGGQSGGLLVFDAGSGQLAGGPHARPVESGHDGWIWAIAASPDGRRLVSAGEDRTLRLWALGDDGSVRPSGNPMFGHAGPVKAVAFSPDGTKIVSGSTDRTLRLWDAETGRSLGALLEEHNGPVNAVAFSPDGSHIASGSEDSTVRLWDATTRWPIGKPLEGHEDGVRAVVFSPDGRRLASAGEDRTVRLWDADVAAPGRTDDPPAPQVLRGHAGGLCCVAFSHDGETVVSGSWDGELRLWAEKRNDRRLWVEKQAGGRLRAYSRGLTAVAFAPNGRIASASDGGGIALWNPDESTSRILSGHWRDPVDKQDPYVMTDVAYSRRASRIAYGSWDRTVRVWEVGETGSERQIAEFDAGTKVWSVALNDNGSQVAAGGDDGAVRLWDVPGKRLIREFEPAHAHIVWSVAFSPDGRRLASASQDGTVRLWDIVEGRAIDPPLVGHQGGVNSVAFDPAGTRLVSGGDDGSVRVWDVARHRERPLQLRADGPVLAVAFSPDGRTIAAGGVRGTTRESRALHVWDLEDGSAPKKFGSRTDRLTGVAFASDRQVIAASADGALRQWVFRDDRPGRRSLDARFSGHEDRANAVAVSPDRSRIVSAGSDGTVRLWPGQKIWPDKVCEKLTRNMSRSEWNTFVSDKDEYECQCRGLPIPADGPDRITPDQTPCAKRAPTSGDSGSGGHGRSAARIDGRS